MIVILAVEGGRCGINGPTAIRTERPARSLVLSDRERALMAVSKPARWCTVLWTVWGFRLVSYMLNHPAEP
jgi:hypothetical protein